MDLDDVLDLESSAATTTVAAPSSRRPSRFAPKGAKPIPTSQPSVIAVKEEEEEDRAPLPSSAANVDVRPKPDEESCAEPMKEDYDLVECEFDVFFIPSPVDENTELYVLQYPLRPSWRPYELEERCTEVRVKANGVEVQVDLALNKYSVNYDQDAPVGKAMENQEETPFQTLASSWSPSLRSGYAVGVLSGRKLYLNPVHAVLQLRPSMEYLNHIGSMKRGNMENFVKAEVSPGESLVRQSKKQHKQPSEDVVEQWTSLKYHGVMTNLSMTYLRKMLEELNSPIQFSVDAMNYLDSLCPGTTSNKKRAPIRYYLSLPLKKRFEVFLAEGPPVNRFAALKHLAPDDPVEDVLQILQECALLVQGLWVLKSSKRISNAKTIEQAARDYALLLFSQSPIIKNSHLAEVGSRINIVRESMKEFAVYRPSLKDWKFREPTDLSFLKSFPETVKKQEQTWKEREPFLRGTFLEGKIRPHSRTSFKNDRPGSSASFNKDGVKAGNELRAGNLAMSDEARDAVRKALRKLFQNHKICSFQTICQGLRDIAVSMHNLPKSDHRAASAIASVIDAPREEFEALINETAIKIHNVYVLKSSEQPEFNPLRNVVIELLNGKEQNTKLKKAEIVEAVKSKLQREIRNDEFQKVITELCVSSGGAWVLKSGDGAPK